MRFVALAILAAALPPIVGGTTVWAATVTVTLTGTTGPIQVGEGPIFGHRSYQLIAPGDPFVLTYTFDESRGKQKIVEVSDGLITRSETESTALASPGSSAVLQIGSAVWEFGASTRSQIILETGAARKSEKFVFATQSGGNRISAEIFPAKNGYWPRNGDWRASFIATSLDAGTVTFSADNNSVSAAGTLIPVSLTVTGVDTDGQWLRSTPPGDAAHGERKWELAHPSPAGGFIVEEVIRTIQGTKQDGSPIHPAVVRYWQAWQIPRGSNTPQRTVDGFIDSALSGSKGEENIEAVARFYEGLSLPPAFALGNNPYAGELLSSDMDPALPTNNATLPVVTSATRIF